MIMHSFIKYSLFFWTTGLLVSNPVFNGKGPGKRAIKSDRGVGFSKNKVGLCVVAGGAAYLLYRCYQKGPEAARNNRRIRLKKSVGVAHVSVYAPSLRKINETDGVKPFKKASSLGMDEQPNKMELSRSKTWGASWYEILEGYREYVINESKYWQAYFVKDDQARKRLEKEGVNMQLFLGVASKKKVVALLCTSIDRVAVFSSKTSIQTTFSSLGDLKACLKMVKELIGWGVYDRDIVSYRWLIKKREAVMPLLVGEEAVNMQREKESEENELKKLEKRKGVDQALLTCQALEDGLRNKLVQIRVWVIVEFTPLTNDLALMIAKMVEFDFKTPTDR